jgi:hypothetical protein
MAKLMFLEQVLKMKMGRNNNVKEVGNEGR